MCICDPLIQNLIPGTCYWEKLHRAAIMKTPKKHPIFQNGCCSGVSVNMDFQTPPLSRHLTVFGRSDGEIEGRKEE